MFPKKLSYEEKLSKFRKDLKKVLTLHNKM